MKKLVPENTHPARLRLGLLKRRVVSEVEEAGPVPVLRGLFCYYPLVCRGLFSVPVLLYFFFIHFFFVSPRPVFVIQLVLVRWKWSDTDIVVIAVRCQCLEASYKTLLM